MLERFIFNKGPVLRSLRKKRLRLRYFTVHSVEFLYIFPLSDWCYLCKELKIAYIIEGPVNMIVQ